MDPVRLALFGMSAGSALGVAVISGVTLGVDLLKSRAAAPGAGAPLYLLFFGTLVGLVAAGLFTWSLLSPVRSTYRRGGLSLVSALATVLPMWLCVAANQVAGRPGLVGLGALAFGAALLLGRATRRSARA